MSANSDSKGSWPNHCMQQYVGIRFQFPKIIAMIWHILYIHSFVRAHIYLSIFIRPK